jgi:hypothetical protein
MVIGANVRARELIGSDTKNVDEIWMSREKKKLPPKLLSNGCMLLQKEGIQVNGFWLDIDMEITVFLVAKEHIVAVLLEQSYKKAFEMPRRSHVPRIFWKDAQLKIKALNEINQKNLDVNKELEPGYVAESAYERAVLRKTFQFEKKLIDEQGESYGEVQQVNSPGRNQGFAKINRLTVVGKGNQCIGMLVICESLEEKDEAYTQICSLLRKNAAMEKALEEENYFVYCMKEEDNERIDYLSAKESCFGYTMEELCTGDFGWLDLICEEDKPRYLERKNPMEEIEYHIHTKTGEKVKVHEKPSGYQMDRDGIYRQGLLWIVDEDGGK